MCGIYGYVGHLDAYKQVIMGLRMLQYRGYDSCGVACYHDEKFELIKAVGVLDNLRPPEFASNIAFGHTRWATNGEVNLLNTHPHVSHDSQFAIVHNGIIKNAQELKQSLLKQGVEFYSQTDTEVIANLLSALDGEIDARVSKLFDLLDGSFSLIIGHKSGDLYLVKKFSPLNLLISEDGIYMSSDISSLKSGNLYSLQDNDVIKISHGVISFAGKDAEICFTPYENDIKILSTNKYNHFMLKEIYDIPSAIYSTYNELKSADVKKIFKGIKKITFLGCGTAYHSCLIGEYLFKRREDFDVQSCLASNYEICTSQPKIAKNHLHVIVSQSGETADCIKVAEEVKSKGGKILLITNEPKSSITKYADYILPTSAGKELAVASTKTYTAQIFVFAYVFEKLKDENYSLDIIKLRNMLKTFIENINMNDVAKILEPKDKLIMIARDIDYITILEASLKIREIDYVYTLPMFSGELKHGTLSLIDKDSIVLSLNTDLSSDKLRTAINEIESRNGVVIEFNKYLRNIDVDPIFMPIFAIIPFQILSYQIAINKGQNPDMPRNLAKSVTVE